MEIYLTIITLTWCVLVCYLVGVVCWYMWPKPPKRDIGRVFVSDEVKEYIFKHGHNGVEVVDGEYRIVHKNRKIK